MTPHEASIVAEAREIVARYMPKRDLLTSYQTVCDYLTLHMAGERREVFRCLFLDRKNRLIADEIMGAGTIDHVPVYPREVAKRALELDASAVILAHNHPSGDPEPSLSDIDMTHKIVAALDPLGIVVHDHFVVGREIKSFRAAGLDI